VGAAQDVTERVESEANRERAVRAEATAEREHRIAQTLQHSLLPDRLPELGVLELAARYLPGGGGAEVGGDWYDVIELPGGEVGRYVPLGVVPAVGYRAARGHLEPGDMILLYTDGLVERPGVPLTATLEALRQAAWRNGSADALCDATLASMLPAGAERDDVA